MRITKRGIINPRIVKHLWVLASAFAFCSGDQLQCQKRPTEYPIETTVTDLVFRPDKFDGHIVRVRAILAVGWEGDNFIADPNPQTLPSGGPVRIWIYGQTGAVRSESRSSQQSWFTGYFHYVPKSEVVNGVFDPGPYQFGYFHYVPKSEMVNGVFDPGPYQFESISGELLEPQRHSRRHKASRRFGGWCCSNGAAS